MDTETTTTAPKRSRKKPALPSVEIVTEPAKRLTASRLREMVATRKAEIAKAEQDAFDADFEQKRQVAEFVAASIAKDHPPALAAEMMRTAKRLAGPPPRPQCRAELASVSPDQRNLVWSLRGLEEKWAFHANDLLVRIKATHHNGGTGNQLHALQSLSHSGLLAELQDIDLFLRVLKSSPDLEAAIAIVEPLEWEVAALDEAESEHRRRVQEAQSEHERIVAEARLAAEAAIATSPEVMASIDRVFQLLHPPSI